MNWNLLRSLIAVQRSGGVGRAAKALGLSQPALSNQLKILESELGAELFTREGRTLALNQLGIKAAEAGYRMAEIFDTLGSEIRAARTGQAQRLTFAVERDLDRPYFVQVVSRTLDRLEHKPAQIRIQAEFDKPIAEELRNGTVDIAFTSDGAESIGLEPFLTVELPVVLVASEKWLSSILQGPKATQESTVLKAIANMSLPLILPSKSSTLHTRTRDFLAQHSITQIKEIELWPMTAVACGVVEGLGASFLPLNYVRKNLAQKEMKLLLKRTWNWGLKYYCYQTPILVDSPARDAILEVLETQQRDIRKYGN